jgi:hypothetical protein
LDAAFRDADVSMGTFETSDALKGTFGTKAPSEG